MPDGLSSSRLEDLQMRWQQDPESRVYLQLAEEYRKLDRHPEAIDVLKRGLRSRPNDLSGQVALGRCHLEMEEYDSAAQALETVVGRDPTHIVGNKLLLEAYLHSGDAAKAGERLDLYKLLNPADPDLGGLDSRLRKLRHSASPAPARPAAAEPPAPSGGEAAAPVVEAPDANPFETWPGKKTEPPAQPPAPPAPEIPEPPSGPLAFAEETAEIKAPTAEELWGRPAEGRPAEGRPAEGRPAEGRPAEGRPAEEPEPRAEEPEPRAEEPEPRAAAAPFGDDDIFDLGPPGPPPSLDELFDLGPAPPTPSLDDLWGPTTPSEPAAVKAEELSAPEPVEELSAPEPVEELSAPEPVEELSVPEPTWAETYDEVPVSEPVEEAAIPVLAEEPATPEPVEEMAAAEPDVPELVYELADESEEIIEVAEPEEPVEPEPATATLGELYLKQGHVEEAERIFRQVLQKNPGSAAAMAGLARIRGETGLSAHALLARAGRRSPAGLTAKKIQVLESYVQTLRQAAGRIHVP